jgi:hypothetical protein
VSKGEDAPLLSVDCQALVVFRLVLELQTRVLHQVFEWQACAGAPDDLSEKLHTPLFDRCFEFGVWERVEARNLVVRVELLRAPVLEDVEEELQALHVVVINDLCINQLALST